MYIMDKLTIFDFKKNDYYGQKSDKVLDRK